MLCVQGGRSSDVDDSLAQDLQITPENSDDDDEGKNQNYFCKFTSLHSVGTFEYLLVINDFIVIYLFLTCSIINLYLVVFTGIMTNIIYLY